MHKPRESEYGTQERHAQVHRFAEREWNEIYSTHLRGRICVYAYAPAAPRGHWRWREEAEEREKLSIFPAAFTTSRKPRFSRKNTRPCMGRSLLGT